MLSSLLVSPQIEDLEEEEGEKGEKGETPTKKTKKVKQTVTEWKLLNDQPPLWCRKPDDVTEEEYKAFYKKVSKDYSDPLTYKHFHTEGQVELNCLLYIPEKPPNEMFEQQKKTNIKLYVKKVFIMDDCDDLLPEWLKFRNIIRI